MIESISIADAATFNRVSAEVLGDLRQFNYIFGSNGTGKTTISRVIADPQFNANCQCRWKDGRPLEALVLNRDFTEKNFGQLRGVFTLGEKQKDTESKITAAKKELDEEQDRRNGLKRTLEGDDGTGGRRNDLAKLEDEYRERFWKPVEKIKREGKLVGALQGVLNNKKECKQKILSESLNNTAALVPIIDMEKRAATIFGETPTRETLIPALDTAALLVHQSNPILTKKIIGKEDVDIAAMIQKLGASDWVRQGLPFYEANNGTCPFCQQNTTEAFATSLEEYFDESFQRDTRAINEVVSSYAADSKATQLKIDNIIATPSKFLNFEQLKLEKTILDQAINVNVLHLDNKKKEPSKIVGLEAHDEVLKSITQLISTANSEAVAHNKTIDNLAVEQKKLTAEVWRFVLAELAGEIKQYRDTKEALEKAIAGIQRSITESDARMNAKRNEIRELEKQATSIQPTIDAINDILFRFGFDSFKLAMASDSKHYSLVRQNGDDAILTLSEGEKTFVVFLYFYHLLKGSMAESGMTTDRIVVFDDPVSSLDSDVLFVVSSLIKEICDNCRSGIGPIKQVFLLTHNVYFHKEVTYNTRRPNGGILSEESFWITRKTGQFSKVSRYNLNPIKTSYELLWMDVREAHTAILNGAAVKSGIQNTLRRILEHYFTILGSVDRDDICAQFEGHEKLICKSLFSWVNAGSHSPIEDVEVTPSETMVQNYLNVFKAIFEKTSHDAHYQMMMGPAVSPTS